MSQQWSSRGFAHFNSGINPSWRPLVRACYEITESLPRSVDGGPSSLCENSPSTFSHGKYLFSLDAAGRNLRFSGNSAGERNKYPTKNSGRQVFTQAASPTMTAWGDGTSTAAHVLRQVLRFIAADDPAWTTTSILHCCLVFEDYTAVLAEAIKPPPTIPQCGTKQEQVPLRPLVRRSRRPIAGAGVMCLSLTPA
jgi:hypothetical protein